ncbi:unnamed protein product [Rotaria sordida]|uniref:Uncharacterized protein n=1 Tax=Rotaria sordida TaxID=392033 RepID=A0A819P7I2_9BILA|nr:unnamed protein product [Rotaria sordida]CAF1258176.1 unnamed protein product [Rotaria sordida]CAF1367301.1 unnamed protein product [Rotaria sordida]CAF1468782.1 unnamed protein product [Rotaria sordida]CAF1483089.1 unnamed protein product [Rotaria sordida]
MRISYKFYLTIIYLSSYLILLISGNENKSSRILTINIKYGKNDTFILNYNLTTNYPYYLTFRLFEHEQRKFGLYPPTYQYQQNTIEIFNQYNISKELFYLFIICFYFIRPLNDIDIQCKDIRLLKTNETNFKDGHRPSYKPLFVLVMYILCFVMILPVIIQHRRRKMAQLVARRKQLRRLSIKISQDHPDILSQIIQRGHIDLTKIPLEMEDTSLLSPNAYADDIDDHEYVSFTIPKRKLSFSKYNHDESDVTADDCVAHLLNNTPWNSSLTQQPTKSILRKNRSPSETLEEQSVPMLTLSYDNDDQQTISKSNIPDTKNSSDINSSFSKSSV